MSARFIFETLPGGLKTLQGKMDEEERPRWLKSIRRWNWVLFILTVFGVATVVFKCNLGHLHQI